MPFAVPATNRRWQMTIRICLIVLALCLLGFLVSKGAIPAPENRFWGKDIYSETSLSLQDAHPQGRLKSLDCAVDSDLNNALKAYLKPNFVILIGEMHGTEESPQFAQDVVCSALRAQRRVTVALEIPKQEEAPLQNFLQGQPFDFSASSFWKSDYQDGRRSVAMHRLIEKLRSWRGDHYPVRLLAIDEPESHGEQRETAMAESLEADIKENAQDVHIVLTGNIHSRLTRGTPWDRNYAPMGVALASLAKGTSTSIVSLDPRYYAGGSAYICVGDDGSTCGVNPLTPKAGKLAATDFAGRGVSISQIEPNLFQGYYYFTTPVKSSEPAFVKAVSVASR
jgi:hypothetical protein